MEKICWQITVAALMHPLQYNLQSPAAKDISITHAAAAPSNLDSHSNAICNHSFKKRIELRTQEQPFLQNT